jgi:hypothetical protein
MFWCCSFCSDSRGRLVETNSWYWCVCVSGVGRLSVSYIITWYSSHRLGTFHSLGSAILPSISVVGLFRTLIEKACIDPSGAMRQLLEPLSSSDPHAMCKTLVWPPLYRGEMDDSTETQSPAHRRRHKYFMWPHSTVNARSWWTIEWCTCWERSGSGCYCFPPVPVTDASKTPAMPIHVQPTSPPFSCGFVGWTKDGDIKKRYALNTISLQIRCRQ